MINRREFIGLTIGSLLFGGDLAYASRLGKPEYTIRPDIANWLNELAVLIGAKIRQDKLNPVIIENQSFQPRFNEKTFSRSLLYLSYLDGGEDEANNVAGFIQDRGLHIKEIPKDGALNFVASGAMKNSKGSGNPIEISIGRKIVESYNLNPLIETNRVILEELYHRVQQARNPDLTAITDLITVFFYLSAGGLTGFKVTKLIYKDLLKNQNVLFKGFISGVFGVATVLPGVFAAKSIGAFLEPKEVQANMQTNYMVLKEPINSLRGTFITYSPL